MYWLVNYCCKRGSVASGKNLLSFPIFSTSMKELLPGSSRSHLTSASKRGYSPFSPTLLSPICSSFLNCASSTTPISPWRSNKSPWKALPLGPQKENVDVRWLSHDNVTYTHRGLWYSSIVVHSNMGSWVCQHFFLIRAHFWRLFITGCNDIFHLFATLPCMLWGAFYLVYKLLFSDHSTCYNIVHCVFTANTYVYWCLFWEAKFS